MVDVGRWDVFLNYSYVCMVKTMSFENEGSGWREQRADKDQLTRKAVKSPPKPPIVGISLR